MSNYKTLENTWGNNYNNQSLSPDVVTTPSQQYVLLSQKGANYGFINEGTQSFGYRQCKEFNFSGPNRIQYYNEKKSKGWLGCEFDTTKEAGKITCYNQETGGSPTNCCPGNDTNFILKAGDTSVTGVEPSKNSPQCAAAPPPPSPPPAYSCSSEGKAICILDTGGQLNSCSNNYGKLGLSEHCFNNCNYGIPAGTNRAAPGSYCANDSGCCSGKCFIPPGQIGGLCEDKDGNPPCIGSSTLLRTENGIQALGNITPGTKVITWNTVSNKEELKSLLGIFRHGETKQDHLELLTDTGDQIILSDEHYIYLRDGSMVHAKTVKVGYKLNNDNIVVQINNVQDIPLTPVLENGTVIAPGGAIISSWSGTMENAKLMDKLVQLIQGFVATHTVEETASMIQNAYEEFRLEGKKQDDASLLKIAKKYNIPLPKTISV